MNDVRGKHWIVRTPFVGIKPGDFIFSNEHMVGYAENGADTVHPEGGPKWLAFACPRGRGECSVPLFPQTTGKGHTWKWDGNREAPTLTPSINCLACNPENPAEKYAGCGWHGHLRDGVFVE